jgi:hypothetical protein
MALIDMVSGGGRHDELERLRDPSHTRALSEQQLREVLSAVRRAPLRTATREHTMDAETWLERAHTAARERQSILAALAGEADGGPATGLRAGRAGSQLTVTQRWMLVAG